MPKEPFVAVVPPTPLPISSSSSTPVLFPSERRQSNAKLFEQVTPVGPLEDGNVPTSAKNGKAETEGSRGKRRRHKELFLRYASLSLMVVQYSVQVLLTRQAMTSPHRPPFIKTVAVVLKEAVEAVLSLLLFVVLHHSQNKAAVFCSALFHPSQLLGMLLPALAYTLKNFLLFVAIDHLDAATFTVSYQLKILASAIFIVLLLKRRISSPQWLALCILVGGVAIVQLNAKWSSATDEIVLQAAKSAAEQSPIHHNTSDSSFSVLDSRSREPAAEQFKFVREAESFSAGLCAVLAACLLSGYAGVYLEKVVKQPGDSLWLRNFQLTFLSIIIGTGFALLMDGRQILSSGPLVGFDQLVCVVVLVQVVGGLLVGMVVRYGDNILKAFGNSVAILAISVLSALLFDSPLGWLFACGTVLVAVAMVLYTLFPAAQTRQQTREHPNPQ